ncbi:Aminotransferase class I and II OS=Tsukamurella paurometabola (strain ATCC 8368 / DSM / CCUG 35730 / CIP 100753 / JCM 10117 / KCTC 9821 / NBRC 16120 / NCIMB 702349 / NCTC 13040) OX=521096 GN=Tpau_0804 PE=4 SV=1 [Tsukamurella paurometabola]|uniref:Aminotransferase class I and II n=1 Tax=Tsukamurella paurometabola (strain ATCC 8368 / DSM 20162 / CCUG 35730 / CIP 100753 / JCM 10117 / KCTC 9821 / NBRC 16120 / NCIMB 702349 / NCTC 13040) TaxID=521096 RepID=D5UTT6_TSUPD|nr:pyridoxal phosphate-dependent aminotransferase [Tsukamurella paurometabola]ADG77440.1 aminotransferase class I and II [Tsukamurella paurometabola DSM 20162]SUP27054.1 DAP-AT [Tsukamurella paurometabola]
MRTVHRLRPFMSTIFAEVSTLAVEHDAVNLGQGFPDTDGPAGMLAAAKTAIDGGMNQYPSGDGLPELRRAVAAQVQRDYGLGYDPNGEVLVTVGASEGIAAAVLGLVEPGREVILIEPFYDSYAATVAMAGAHRVVVPLVEDAGRYALDPAMLRAAVTEKTAAIIVNSPHNPTGTVLSHEDLQLVAAVCVERDLLCFTDEVYEHLLFDGRVHTPLATFEGMRERTVRISGAAKSFNVTGWKVGWITAPRELADACRAAKQWLTFTGAAPLQHAVAHALDSEGAWLAQLAPDLQAKRDLLTSALHETGFTVHPAEGTYFVCADARGLGYDDAGALCREMPGRIGVAAVPVSALADDHARWGHLLRFAFSKQADVLAEGTRRLAALGGRTR